MNKKPLIKQNQKSYFKIKKHSLWKYCIEVSFDSNEDIDIFNLYLLLKSFILNNLIPCYSIAISWIDLKEKIVISENINILKFKKMSYYDFVNWLEWRIYNDRNYTKKDNFFSFLILFEKNIIILKKYDLDFFSPIYPWPIDFIHSFKKEERDIDFLLKKNKEYLKEIENLRNIIKSLKK